MNATTQNCAEELMEVVPLMMRVIRTKVRSHSSPELSIVQFRALAFLGRNDRAMLGEVAGFLALTLPAASKLIDGLVAAGLARRAMHTNDRRKIALGLTPAGRKKYAVVLDSCREFLGERVARLSARQQTQLSGAMSTLRTLFADVPPEIGEPTKTSVPPVS